MSFIQNLKYLLRSLKIKNDDLSIDLRKAYSERNGLVEENKTLKSQYDDTKKLSSREQHFNENYMRTLEEDLIYYRNLCKEYEKTSSLNVEKNERSIKNIQSDRIQKFNYSINDSLSNENLKKRESNNQCQASYSSSYQPNQSLENFRRNKVK